MYFSIIHPLKSKLEQFLKKFQKNFTIIFHQPFIEKEKLNKIYKHSPTLKTKHCPQCERAHPNAKQTNDKKKTQLNTNKIKLSIKRKMRSKKEQFTSAKLWSLA